MSTLSSLLAAEDVRECAPKKAGDGDRPEGECKGDPGCSLDWNRWSNGRSDGDGEKREPCTLPAMDEITEPYTVCTSETKHGPFGAMRTRSEGVSSGVEYEAAGLAAPFVATGRSSSTGGPEPSLYFRKADPLGCSASSWRASRRYSSTREPDVLSEFSTAEAGAAASSASSPTGIAAASPFVGAELSCGIELIGRIGGACLGVGVDGLPCAVGGSR